MKSWWRNTILILMAAALGCFAVLALMIFSPYPKPPPGVREAKVIHTWLYTWANEHGGRLPDKVEDLTKIDAGVDASLFPPIIEYRGAGKNLNDTPPDTLLLRYRAGKNGELETRVTFGGASRAKKTEAWSGPEATQ